MKIYKADRELKKQIGKDIKYFSITKKGNMQVYKKKPKKGRL